MSKTEIAEKTPPETPSEETEETTAEATKGTAEEKPAPEETSNEEASDEKPTAKKKTKKPKPKTAPLTKGPLVRAAMAVTAAAALAAGWFGWSAYSASQDDAIAYAQLRDEALRAADQAVVNLNTLDYRNPDAGLKVWQDSTTAELYNQIVQGREKLKQDVVKMKTTSTAKILESALTELDAHAGKAAVIVAVRTTITTAEGRANDQTRRLTGQLTKTPSGWKLSSLGQAPTANAGS